MYSIIILVILVALNLFGVYVNGNAEQSESECEKIASETRRAARATIILKSSDRLAGTWISEGCETRPGPEYLLRVYTFTEEGTYSAIQHHYWDESCTSPRYTISSKGRIRLGPDSFITSGATTTDYQPNLITVMAHDLRAANEFNKLMETNCPANNLAEQRPRTWRPYEEYTVYDATNNRVFTPLMNHRPRLQRRHIRSNGNYHAYVTNRQLHENSGYIECLASLRSTFNELRFLKVQLRPEFRTRYTDGKRMNFELLLGDIHSRKEYKDNYISSGFQTPLNKVLKNVDNVKVGGEIYNISNCQLCSIITGRSTKNPPHLMKKPQLPPYISGEWTSTRCETRPMGLYLTRQFRFYSGDATWIGEHKFYTDPFCTIRKFVVTAAGHFKIGPGASLVKGSTNVDFQIERASLTVFDKRMLIDLQYNNRNCGSGPWKLGVPRELGSTNGCLQLGILIPSIQYEIIRIEVDFRGSTLLLLGQVDTDNQHRTRYQRPTAYQDPLVHCGNLPLYSENLRDILNSPIDENEEEYFTTFNYFHSGTGTSALVQINLVTTLIFIQFINLIL